MSFLRRWEDDSDTFLDSDDEFLNSSDSEPASDQGSSNTAENNNVVLDDEFGLEIATHVTNLILSGRHNTFAELEEDINNIIPTNVVPPQSIRRIINLIRELKRTRGITDAQALETVHLTFSVIQAIQSVQSMMEILAPEGNVENGIEPIPDIPEEPEEPALEFKLCKECADLEDELIAAGLKSEDFINKNLLCNIGKHAMSNPVKVRYPNEPNKWFYFEESNLQRALSKQKGVRLNPINRQPLQDDEPLPAPEITKAMERIIINHKIDKKLEGLVELLDKNVDALQEDHSFTFFKQRRYKQMIAYNEVKKLLAQGKSVSEALREVILHHPELVKGIFNAHSLDLLKQVGEQEKWGNPMSNRIAIYVAILGIERTSFFANKKRKQDKIDAFTKLQGVIEGQGDVSAAIKDIKKEYPQLTRGFFSTRSRVLLTQIEESLTKKPPVLRK